MKNPNVRAVLIDGRAYHKQADGSLVPVAGKTDWKRVDRTTDKQATALAEADADASPMTDAEWARSEIEVPNKVPVGLKLDADVLAWLKKQGRYQTRINAILRVYYETHRKAG